jgi:ADP-ribosylglycohydrolase
MPAATSERDRALGALYGLALGDAAGMPTQEMPRSRAVEVLVTDEFVDAPDDQTVSAGLPAGTVTDDTEQMLVLARLLVDGDGHVDVDAFAHRLLAWERAVAARGSLDLLGPSTKRALAAITRGEDPTLTGRTGTTNGAAMRVAPVGVATAGDDLSALVRTVVSVDRPTHDTTVAHAGAAAVAAAVSTGVAGEGFEAALARAVAAAHEGQQRGQWVAAPSVAARIGWAVRLVDDERARSGETHALDLVDELVGTSLATQESVPAAFAVAWLYRDEPWRGVCAAARLGGDSDTIAAMAGAVLGSCHGLSGWPRSAVEQVRAVNSLDLEPVVDALLVLRHRGAAA